MNDGAKHLKVGVVGTYKDTADIFGGGYGGLIVLVGVDEPEEKLEVLRVVLV
jgi:hypothetical protein